MEKLLKSSIGRLRIVAFLEGLSLLLLLFIAMPLKYFFDQPEMTSIIGSAHGFLFLLFVGLVIYEAISRSWEFWSRTLPLLVSSFVPFGTFYMDSKVLKKIED